jgi:hypothetical protein
MTAPVRALLDELGGAAGRRPAPNGERSSPHLFVVATGGTERLLLDSIAAPVTHPAEPTVLVAHRAHNSLPAALETLAAIQQVRWPRAHRVARRRRRTDRHALDEAIGDLAAIAAMHSARLGSSAVRRRGWWRAARTPRSSGGAGARRWSPSSRRG